MSDAPHIDTTSQERLVHMANQIARFFASQPGREHVDGVTRHIADYWDPRMRRLIREHLAAGGEGLEPIARQAIAALKR